MLFCVLATLAAGDDEPPAVESFGGDGQLEGGNGNAPEACAEIMAGARFPASGGGGLWDACVCVKDVACCCHRRCIAVTAPVAAKTHRQLAGGNVRAGEAMLRAGQVVHSSHVLPLTLVGIAAVPVMRRLAVGIWSTGREILAATSAPSVRDVNGPFLVAAVREAGALPSFLGAVNDDLTAVEGALREQAAAALFNVLLTTGGAGAHRRPRRLPRPSHTSRTPRALRPGAV